MGLLFLPLEAEAQNTLTLTHTSTTTGLFNNPILGCTACAAVPNHDPGTPFPDTSTPLFLGDPKAADLPATIAKGLAPNNQFGVGIPKGDSGTPLFHSTPFDLSEAGLVISVENDMASLSRTGGGRSNTFSSRVSQITPGVPGTTSPDQHFSILFSIHSLTDPDGNLIGSATGTFIQQIDGVTTQGTVQFDSTNGFSGTNISNVYNFTK